MERQNIVVTVQRSKSAQTPIGKTAVVKRDPLTHNEVSSQPHMKSTYEEFKHVIVLRCLFSPLNNLHSGATAPYLSIALAVPSDRKAK